MTPQKKLKENPEINELMQHYARAIKDCHGIDIYQRGVMRNTFYSSLNRFIKVYGMENAKGIIDTAFYGKYKGRFNNKIIGDELFVSGFDWMSREILNEYLATRELTKGWIIR